MIVSDEIQDTEGDVGNDRQSEEDSAIIEAELVSKPSAVDVVRNLLGSVSDQMSPIAAPRRSLRKSDYAENINHPGNISKPSLILVETKVDNDLN